MKLLTRVQLYAYIKVDHNKSCIFNRKALKMEVLGLQCHQIYNCLCVHIIIIIINYAYFNPKAMQMRRLHYSIIKSVVYVGYFHKNGMKLGLFNLNLRTTIVLRF